MGNVSNHPPNCHPFIHPTTSFNLSSSIYPVIPQLCYVSIHSILHPALHHPSIHSTIYPSNHPIIHPLTIIQPPNSIYYHPSIYLSSIHPPNYLSSILSYPFITYYKDRVLEVLFPFLFMFIFWTIWVNVTRQMSLSHNSLRCSVQPATVQLLHRLLVNFFLPLLSFLSSVSAL